MSRDIVTTARPPRRWGPWAALAVILLALFAVVVGVSVVVGRGGGLAPSIADMQGGPVRVADDGRVYVLTNQDKIYKARRRRPLPTGRFVDVWAFDAADARPVWRTRLLEERDVNVARRLLGAQGGVLWLVDGHGLAGLRLSDGAKAYDTAAIEAATPALKGLVPTEAEFYRFDRGGVAFTAADGQAWRLTGDGAKAARAGPEPARAARGVAAAARLEGANGTAAFYARGVAAGGRWVGLLHESEAPRMLAGNQIGGAPPASDPKMGLWAARILRKPEFLGDRGAYVGLAPLPRSPAFLQPSLLATSDALTQPFFSSRPVVAASPDSVFVLHADRLGEAGRLRLSRVASADGKVLWTADLPAQALEAVMPGERSIVLMANRDEPPAWRPPGDTRMERVPQLIAIDVATGKVGVYGFRSVPGRPGEIPPSSTPPPAS